MAEHREAQLALDIANERLAALQRKNAALEARYAAVLRHAGVGIATTTLDGTLTESNQALQQMLGCDAQALQGAPLAAWTHGDDRDEQAGFLLELARGGREHAAYDARYLHRDGRQVVAQVGLSLVRDAQHAPDHIVAIVHDVTDLAETRSRAEILYASASVGIWDWIDVHGDKEHWTPRFYELLGYEDGEIPATLANFRDALHPDDQEATFAAVQAHFERRVPFALDYRLRGKSGEYRWYHGTGRALFDSQGNPTRMVGSIHDIHEERIAKEQLERLALRSELSLRASNIGLWDWDVVANHIIWDEQMYKLYGVRAEQWSSVYDGWVASVHPDDRRAADQQVQEALRGEAEFDTEFRILWPSAEVRTLRAIATVVRDEAGLPLRMVGVNWDVTAAHERTAELERVNKELGEFAYFASHDLQTPIRHVATFVSLLKQEYADRLDGTALEWLDHISDGTTRMRNLVEDLLAYSRVGQAGNRTVAVSLARIVDQVAEVLRGGGAVPLSVTYDSLPTVVGNPVQLEQLVQNLLANAVRYAKPNATPTVSITWDESATHWSVHVRDEGIGIDPKHHQVIFEPFQRLTPHDGSGSGIGLAICSKVAARHGGGMAVASALGEGSVFTFRLKKVSPAEV